MVVRNVIPTQCSSFNVSPQWKEWVTSSVSYKEECRKGNVNREGKSVNKERKRRTKAPISSSSLTWLTLTITLLSYFFFSLLIFFSFPLLSYFFFPFLALNKSGNVRKSPFLHLSPFVPFLSCLDSFLLICLPIKIPADQMCSNVREWKMWVIFSCVHSSRHPHQEHLVQNKTYVLLSNSLV